jgi:signal transduction histidine kinase
VLSRTNGERAAELTRLAAALDAERERTEHAAVVAERTRIAREVHDAVAHSVSVITLHLGGLRRQLDDPEHRAVVHGLERLGRQSVEEMRGLVGILRDRSSAGPPAPEPSLARAGELVSEVGAAGLPVRLEVVGERGAVPRLLDASAYRVVQEALTNAAKHARAGRVVVSVETTATSLRVEVEDDGRGFDSAMTREFLRQGRVGLASMRERVELANGTFVIRSSPGRGTSIVATLPVDTPAGSGERSPSLRGRRSAR